MLEQKSLKELEKQLSKMSAILKTELSRKLNAWTLVDKYLQKTGDYTKETNAGQVVNQLGDKSKITNVEIPVTFINKETAHAYFAGTFLTGYPIFAVTSTREKEETASMLTALVGRDQQRMSWIPEFLRCFDDALRYNVCAMEVLWATKRASSAVTGPEATGIVSPIIYEGNRMKRIDPYNLILDPDVEPHKVHIDGTYVGYVDRINYIALKRMYLELNPIYTYKANLEKIFGENGSTIQGLSSSDRMLDGYTNLYQRPLIQKADRILGNGQDFSHFFGSNTRFNMSGATRGIYEIVHLYKRIIPKEFDIKIPNAGQPQVFYLIWVNGKLAYAEPVNSGHEYLPIVVGQLYPGDLEIKSFVEYICDLQDLATSLMTATLDSMRRAIGGRELYDPTRVRKADIESPSPVAKIPVTTYVYQEGLEGAVKSIPYVDNVSGNFQGLMNTAINLADKTTGLNPSSQGSFVPGNKTMQEFDTIQSNSQARMQLGATQLDGSWLNPIKEIVKLNYLVHAKAETIEDNQTNEVVTIDPAMLRDQAPAFKMSDGLMPATKQANTEVLMSAFNAIQNNPQFSLEYDTMGMMVSILHQQGMTDLNSYKRTPEQKKEYLATVQAQTIAQTPPVPPESQPTQPPTQ